MHNVLKMGKKVFTVSVVVTTIAWSIGLAALLMPLAASAATLSSGDLIKASLPAVYYYGEDGKRYVFPNKKTYDTWYSDFSGVKTITDAELAAIQIGGNVTYRPGVKMVKITTDPKVYAVAKDGTLRWVASESVAEALYGSAWNTMIDDVPDAFFTNYELGANINNASDYDVTEAKNESPSINVDKGLSGTAETGGGALTVAAGAGNPGATTIVADSDTSADDSGQQRVPVMQVNLTAGSNAVSVSSLKFRRSGISKDADVDSLYLMEGDKVVREVTSVSDSMGTFSMASDPVVVTANSVRTLDLVMNLNKAAASGSTISWSLASADVTSDATSVSGSIQGATMTVATVSDLGQLEIGSVNIAPDSVDPGTTNKELWRVSFNADGQDMLVTYVKLTNLGSARDEDLQNLKLMDGATQLNGTVAQVVNKEVVFDLTGMEDGGYKITAGQIRQLTLNADVVGGTDRTYKWTIQKQYDVRAKDMEYGVWAFVDDYDSSDNDAFGVITQEVGGSASTTDINKGTLTVGLSSDSPNTNVVDAGSNLTLAKFDFKGSGEEVKIKTLVVSCTSNDTSNYVDNLLLKYNGTQVGSTDSTIKCDGGTDTTTFSLGNSVILDVGETENIEIVGDLTDSTIAVDETLYVSIDSGTAEGVDSLTSLDSSVTATNGHNLTVKGASVSVFKNSSYTDRSSSQPTGVTNGQDVRVGSFIVVGGDAEDADISQFILRDNATYFMGNNFQNMVLKDSEGNQVGAAIASLNTSDSTYTFTPDSAIRIEEGSQQVYDVYADVKASVTNSGSALTMLEVDQILATGVTTGSSANFGTAGNDSTDKALQKVYLALHGNLTVDESADTPVAQQMVLGSTGVSLAKFKLSADATEDINITEFTVGDDLSNGFLTASVNSEHYATAVAATGSLKNFKLYNGGTLLASVSALDETDNTATPLANFSGFDLTVPKNQNVVLEVKADVTSYADGGVPSSSHRLLVPVDKHLDTKSDQDAVTAVGAGSGISMSKNALDVNGGTKTGNTDEQVVGSYMDLVRAKLSLAFAADSPSGSATPNSEQTVAKFVASNSANVGNYSLHIYNLNFSVSSSGTSIDKAADGGAHNFKVYKDSISSDNELASTDYTDWGNGLELKDTAITQANFTALEVAAGSSKTVIVTLRTVDLDLTSNETLSVGIDANDVQWNDDSSSRSYDYYSVDSLPLSGKTLVY